MQLRAPGAPGALGAQRCPLKFCQYYLSVLAAYPRMDSLQTVESATSVTDS